MAAKTPSTNLTNNTVIYLVSALAWIGRGLLTAATYSYLGKYIQGMSSGWKFGLFALEVALSTTLA